MHCRANTSLGINTINDTIHIFLSCARKYSRTKLSCDNHVTRGIITRTADVLVTSLASNMASHSATCCVFAIQRHYHSLTYTCMRCQRVQQVTLRRPLMTFALVTSLTSSTVQQRAVCSLVAPNMLHDPYALSLTFVLHNY